MLYRVALALLKGCESALLAIDNTGDLINEIKDTCRGAHDRDALMKVRLGVSFPERLVNGLSGSNGAATPAFSISTSRTGHSNVS